MSDPKCPGVCSKHYPKDFCDATITTQEGYPLHRRRDNGVTHPGRHNGRRPFTNQDVVPYNPFLIKKYNCHINVEICSSVKSVKSLYKYVYKGPDQATIEIRRRQGQEEAVPANVDEVAKYLDARYLGPCEAAWRVFSFTLHDEKPCIQRLELHEEGHHMVVFDDTADAQHVRDAADAKVTTLMDYFELNKRDPQARQYHYYDIPLFYVWDKTEKPHH